MSEADAVSDVARITDHVPGGVALMMDALRKGAETFRGAWRSSVLYTRGDLVASEGTVWRALTTAGITAPVEGSTWTAESALPVALLSVLAALLQPGQDLEDAAHPLIALGIDDSEDHALTQIGELVGLRRRDATQITDTRYRVALRAWIRAMRSNGTIGDVEAVATVLAGVASSAAWELEEAFPAGLLLTPTAPWDTDESYVGAIARAVRAAGVRLQIVCPTGAEAFAFADGPEEAELGASSGWADLSGLIPSGGGSLVGVVA